MNVATMGRILLKEYPEIASEIIANNPKIVRLRSPKLPAIEEALIQVCNQYNIDHCDVINGSTHRNYRHTDLRRIVIAVALKLYQPEVLSSKRRKLVHSDLGEMLKSVLQRSQPYICTLTTIAILHYRAYADFRAEVDATVEYILKLEDLA